MMPLTERPVREDDYQLLDAAVLQLSPLRFGPDATFEERLLHELLARTYPDQAVIPVALGQALRRLILRHAVILPTEIVALARRTMHGPPAQAA